MNPAQLEALQAEAYASWEAGDLVQAADLFLAAERMERDLAATRNRFAMPDRSILYKARAGYCLWDAGEFDRARPMLLEVICFDWKSGRLWADRRDTEKAYSRLILEAAASGRVDAFSELWVAARARGAELSAPFPTNVAEQKKLLAAALALRRKDVCRQILDELNPKLLAKHHDLQLLRNQAETLCHEA